MIQASLRRLAALLVLACAVGAQAAPTPVKVGVCSRSMNGALAPFAVATKLGYFAKSGVEVELVPLPGSSDCVKFVGTRQVLTALASVEPLAILRPQGVKARVYYTAYQNYIYGLAVPEASAVKSAADLKGRAIGVTSMASAGAVLARAFAAGAGLDPTRDVRVVVVGEGAQAAALVRKGEVDALSMFDTQYATLRNNGIKLRMLESRDTARFPSNGFIALEETLATQRKQAVAVAQGYAKGTIFALANPEAAVRILWEVFPQARPTGKDEATAMREELTVMQARLDNLKLERSGAKQWGYNSPEAFAAYVEFMQKWGVTQTRVPASELITNELLAEINDFDPAAISGAAKAAGAGRVSAPVATDRPHS